MSGTVAVLIPVKAFGAAKGRLAEVLDGQARADLARSMATIVVAAAAPLPVTVVCDDDDVDAWARSVGADVVRVDGPGLNRAVEAGMEALAADGEAVAVALSSRTGLLAMKNARAEMRYLDKRNGLTTEPLEMLDPVVVDGLEMARARGASVNGLDADFFVHATGETTIEVNFLTPSSLSEAEREEWIGQVMATLEFS